MHLYFYLMFKVLVLSFSLNAVFCHFNLLLLHNNDIHGRFQETSRNTLPCDLEEKAANSCFGGAARITYLVKKFRKDAQSKTGPEVLYLNAGDTFVGTVGYSVYTSEVSAAFMNMLKPDVQCLGSHEFDKGIKELEKYVLACEFPTVCGNVLFTTSSKLNEKVPKSVLVEKGGRKIGVIGYLTRGTAHTSDPEETIFLDELQSVMKESDRLHKAGVNIIVALGHSGYNTDKRIAEMVPHVDLVVGGYSHTFLWNGAQPDFEPIEGPYPTIVKQSNGKKVPVVQAYAYSKYLGVLNLTFDDNGELLSFSGQPILLDGSIPEDMDVLKLVGRKKRQDNEVIAKLLHELDGKTMTCKYKECNYGNLIADAMVMYRSSKSSAKWTDAPIGFINAGAIKGSITTPQITLQQLKKTITKDLLVVMKLNGKDLKNTLEHAVFSYEPPMYGANRFLQFSGIIVTYDVEDLRMFRVVNAKIRCAGNTVNCVEPQYTKHIDFKQNYTIITTKYLAEGGDRYNILKSKGFDREYGDLGIIDILVWYLKANNPVFAEEQGRIKFITTKRSNAADFTISNLLKFSLLVFLYLAT